jgi:hypothetical protein
MSQPLGQGTLAACVYCIGDGTVASPLTLNLGYLGCLGLGSTSYIKRGTTVI